MRPTVCPVSKSLDLPVSEAPRVLSHWIGGTEQRSETGEFIDVLDPRSASVVARVDRGSGREVEIAVAAAAQAQKVWGRASAAERSTVLRDVGRSVLENIDHLLTLEISETGKVASLARSEMESTAAYFEYYGSVIRAEHGETIDVNAMQQVFTRREPYGVVGVITPWNFPLNQAARALAPALAVGNATVLKPSHFTSSSSLAFVRLAEQAGLPTGLVNVVTGRGSEAGAALVRNPGVGTISFTGSVATGKAVAVMAAERLAPVTLELGGKSPNIVFADADLGCAAQDAVDAILTNAGQMCIAGSRLLVERAIHDDVVDRVLGLVSSLGSSDLQPITTAAQYEAVTKYFAVAAADGAQLLTGGPGSTDQRPQFVAPTVYTGVTNQMRIAREEVFGPVLCVMSFDDEEEAGSIANDSPFGLVAGVWTSSLDRAFRMARRLEAGQVMINGWWTPIEAPFGGYKDSGIGRERGTEALRQYTRLKSVILNLSP